jgi:hypothetical protein
MPRKRGFFGVAAAVAGFLAIFAVRYNMAAEYSLIAPFAISYDYPHVLDSNIMSWFDLLHYNPVIGFLSFGFFTIIHCFLATFLYAYHISKRGAGMATRICLLALSCAGSVALALLDKTARLSELAGEFYRAHHFEEKLPGLSEGRRILAEMTDRFSAHNIGRSLAIAAFMGCGLWLAALLARKERKHIVGIAANGLGLLSLAFYFAFPGAGFVPGALYAAGTLVWHFMLSRDALYGKQLHLDGF